MGLFNLFGCSKGKEARTAPKQPELKTVNYRGGVVKFRIPAHWREEYGADGGGIFYDTAPDAGTFRLNVLTVQSPSLVTADSAPDLLSKLREASDGIERLPTGSALIRFTQSSEDRGHRLRITYWIVANPLPPNHGRIANFNHTILDSQRSDPRFQRELELLDREIRAAVFASEIGVTSQ